MIEKENINQKINNAKRKVSDTNIGYATLNLEYLIKLIRTKKQEKPDLSIETILQEIEESYRKIAFSSSSNSSVVTRSDFCMLRALLHVKNHPEVILNTLDTSDRSLFFKKKDAFKYTPNLTESIKELLNDACSIILSRYDLSTKVRFVKGELGVAERIAMQKEILEMISSYLKNFGKVLPASYTSVITEIAQVLDENGCFEKGIERHNRRMRMLGLDEMQEKDTGKKNKSTSVNSMSDWTNPNLVGKLPLETLIMACAFFTNRLCKEYISFKKSVFLLEELNFSEEDIFKNNIVIPEELSSALVKYEFLQTEARKKYAEIKQQHTGPSASQRFEQVSYELDFQPQEYEEYEQIFSTMLPNCTNDLSSDYDRFIQFDNAMEILYQKKDMALDSLIIFLLDNEAKVNWGYIEERTDKGNSIERKKSMVALGFDLSKFNTSIRLHKSLHELKKLIGECNGNDVLSVYAGDEDWLVKDKFGVPVDMNTQVFRMFNKQERKQLKEKSSAMPPQNRLYGFISHLNWLANGAIPQKHTQRNIVHLETGEVKELDPIIR